MPLRYRPARDVSPEFLNTARVWIARTGEVFVLLRYLAAAGAKDHALCKTFPEFEALVASAPRGTDIMVFRDPQFQERGVVTDEFTERVLAATPEGTEFLLLSAETEPGTCISREAASGDTVEDLREILQEFRGRAVAFGPWPDFLSRDREDMISAAKEGIDGPR
jgi:hypothetical protein